jgi:glucose-6-phosphate isomerase
LLNVDLSGIRNFCDPAALDFSAAANAHRTLSNRTGPGSAFTGWLDLPARVADRDLPALQTCAATIRNHSDALVVIGTGGSYLGARAAIELLRSPQHNALHNDPRIFFVGNTLSPSALLETIDLLDGLDFSINMISKSGGTMEPALSFRVFRQLLERKYGSTEAKKRIVITTDPERGPLRTLANQMGYPTFSLYPDVGGRFSVLSAVGLLPMAVAGIDITAVLESAIFSLRKLNLRTSENPAWQYATARQELYHLGKSIEILACYEPSFRYMAEWWKQLFGESEGKNGVGIFPASVEYTADLHSMGQYIQDGPRHLLETVVEFAHGSQLLIPEAPDGTDAFAQLAGMEFGSVNHTVSRAVAASHIEGGVPNLRITVSSRDESGFAELVCFFELACAISGYMLHVNPFDQPGVEAYKSKMHHFLEQKL